MLIAHAAGEFDECDPAFLHAVGLGAQGGAEVATVHVTQGQVARAPHANRLLQRWRVPAERVTQRVYESPGHDDVADEVVAACQALRPDLIVMSTHARK